MEPIYLNLRILLTFIAWCLACLGYAGASYRGGIQVLFLPWIAAVVGTIVVLLMLCAGVVFLIPSINRFWKSSRWIAAGVIILSLLIMFFGAQIGLSQTYTYPDTGEEYLGLRADVAIAAYLLFIFAIIYWPLKVVHRDIETRKHEIKRKRLKKFTNWFINTGS